MKFVSDIFQNGELTTPIDETYNWLREKYLCKLVEPKVAEYRITHKLNAINAKYPDCRPMQVFYEVGGNLVINYKFEHPSIKRIYIRMQEVRN